MPGAGGQLAAMLHTRHHRCVSRSGLTVGTHVKSLFLISLPRSLSTRTYHLLTAALGLRAPAWTSDGEILNLDRHCLFPNPDRAQSRKFLDPGQDPERFEAAIAFLRAATRTDGHIYKDVVQPFAVSTWLPGNGMRALRIVRCLADVAYAMIGRDWLYPGNAAIEERDPEGALIEGLIRARHALDQVPAATIGFDDLTVDEAALWDPVQSLYPDVEIVRRRYIDQAFRDDLAATLGRRESTRYREIAARCEEIADRLE